MKSKPLNILSNYFKILSTNIKYKSLDNHMFEYNNFYIKINYDKYYHLYIDINDKFLDNCIFSYKYNNHTNNLVIMYKHENLLKIRTQDYTHLHTNIFDKINKNKEKIYRKNNISKLYINFKLCIKKYIIPKYRFKYYFLNTYIYIFKDDTKIKRLFKPYKLHELYI